MPSNLGARLASLPRVQQAVGAIEERLSANVLLLSSAARDADAGISLEGPRTALLKLTVTENAIAVAEGALKLTGHGISRSNPLERHYRDVLCGRIHSPQEDFAHIAAGKAGLGL